MITYKQLRQLIHQKSLILRNADPCFYDIIFFVFFMSTGLLLFSPWTFLLIYYGVWLDNIIIAIMVICFVPLHCCWPFALFCFLLVALETHPDNRYEPQRNCPCHQWDRCILERLMEWLHSAWRKLMIRVHSFCPLLFGNRVVNTVSIPADTLSDIVRFIPSDNAPRLWTTSSLFATHFVELHNELEVRLHIDTDAKLEEKEKEIWNLKEENYNLKLKHAKSAKEKRILTREWNKETRSRKNIINLEAGDQEPQGVQQPQQSLWRRTSLGPRLAQVSTVVVSVIVVISVIMAKVVNPECVEESGILLDLKGTMLNGQDNPTIENLEHFQTNNPSFHSMINRNQLDESHREELDLAQLKKSEIVRVDMRKAVETALQKRSKSSNMNFSQKKYKDLGVAIERALFSLYGDVNVKYRRWFKSFNLVINDERNGFFRDVLRDKVSVKKLVTLTADQMNVPIPVAPLMPMAQNTAVVAAADFTLTEETKNGGGDASKQMEDGNGGGDASKQMEEGNGGGDASKQMEDGNGGGDASKQMEDGNGGGGLGTTTLTRTEPAMPVESNDKVGSTTTSRHAPLQQQQTRTTKGRQGQPQTANANAHEKSAIDDILGEMNRDTTHLHNSHLYDSNCGICKKQSLQKFAKQERMEAKEAKRKAEATKQPHFPNMDPAI